MKKLSLIVGLVLLVLCFTSCINAYKTHNVIADVPPSQEHDETDDTINPEEPEKTQTISLTLYFPDSEALYLYEEIREVEAAEDELAVMYVLKELFKGPENDNLSRSVDGENLVNSVVVEDGICTVDFKYDFVVLNTGGTTRESFAIASIVNSLCSLPDVDGVEILIDGNKNAEFGHTMLESEYKTITELVAK